jgi:hypothetical protein
VEAALARSFLKHDPATYHGRMIANAYRDVDRDGQRVLDYEETCSGLAMMHWSFTQVLSITFMDRLFSQAQTNEIGASSMSNAKPATDSFPIQYGTNT